MEIDVKKMIRNKRDFLRYLESLLRLDKVSNGVHSLQYKYNPLDLVFPEVIIITFEGGHIRAINVKGNSNGANLKEVTAAVYGYGECVGLIPHYKKDTAEE